MIFDPRACESIGVLNSYVRFWILGPHDSNSETLAVT